MTQGLVHVSQLALPQGQILPAKSQQILAIALVPGDVGVKLWIPVPGVRPRAPESYFAIVPVPEASVDKDGLAPGAENQVRGAWQLTSPEPDPRVLRTQRGQCLGWKRAVQGVTVAGGMQQPA